MGIDPTAALERARSRSRSRVGRKRTRSVAGMVFRVSSPDKLVLYELVVKLYRQICDSQHDQINKNSSPFHWVWMKCLELLGVRRLVC